MKPGDDKRTLIQKMEADLVKDREEKLAAIQRQADILEALPTELHLHNVSDICWLGEGASSST